MSIPAETSYPVGEPFTLAENLQVVLASNPSPMTFWGTNTYLLGKDCLAIIDPGPENAQHFSALRAAIGTRSVQHILVTHSHLDHSPLARSLSRHCGAPVLAFGDHRAGRSNVMKSLAADGLTGGGEGIDTAFAPDIHLADGDIVGGDWGEVRAIHTPGHIGNHLCFHWQDVLFTGDHVMGWASSLVSPPDGDLTDFMRSCRTLQKIDVAKYYPGHGPVITGPTARLHWLLAHREGRETQIRDALVDRQLTVPALARLIYDDVAPALLPAAERNVFAHLIDLVERGLVEALPRLSNDALFRLNVRRDADGTGM